MTPEQLQFFGQAILWVGGPAAAVGLIWRGIHWAIHVTRAADLAQAHDALIRGNGGDDWSFIEARRRLKALGDKIDQFQEMAAGEHGFYSKFAKYDEALLNWTRWRHDVMDKEMSRLAGEVGAHDDDIEDIRKELALCERRK